MTTNLITFKCEFCGLEAHAHIDRKGVLRFSIRDKLYSKDDILTSKGHFCCIDCNEPNYIRFKVFE